MILIGRNGEITDDSKQDIPKPVPPPVAPTAPTPGPSPVSAPVPPPVPSMPPSIPSVSSSPSPVNPFKPDPIIKTADDSSVVSSLAPEGLPGAMPAEQEIPLNKPVPSVQVAPTAAAVVPVPPAVPPPAITLPPIPVAPPPVPPPPRPIAATPVPPIFKAPTPIPPSAPVTNPTKTPSPAIPAQIPPVATHGFVLKPFPTAATSPTLKNIRTYESDVADVLAQRNTTRASIAIAENARKGEGETLSNSGPSIVTSGAVACGMS